LTPLRSISGKDAIKALNKAGYIVDRQRGSHIILRQPKTPHRRVTIPDHKVIAKGTLRAIIRETGLTVDEFNKLLD
jgi:predicted RNA binding protein YcfA (HicA-like mRNA interferase family)